MSPPGTPGIPERFTQPGVHASIHALASRVEHVEEHTTQLVDDVAAIKKATERFAGYEATVRSLMSRGIVLILGAVGSTYGITRGTAPPATQTRTEVVKSATTVQLEACALKQPGPERDRCAVEILADVMTRR